MTNLFWLLSLFVAIVIRIVVKTFSVQFRELIFLRPKAKKSSNSSYVPLVVKKVPPQIEVFSNCFIFGLFLLLLKRRHLHNCPQQVPSVKMQQQQQRQKYKKQGKNCRQVAL